MTENTERYAKDAGDADTPQPGHSEVPDDVVKAVREAMRETMDSSTFGNPHSSPAPRPRRFS